ncbi:DNA-binding NarL/FixJ family response regulator [Prosthecobacter fusiformis]|uniref:DNA-binding NarL/FixJ family response regulator n=2 Tax=Prosthecobacter fusiformis TaxID=48464 RepID=A0A4R7RZS6_9BACT|nr:DNA-binding NarL/FixJ family response regulator [Prosthecobacter fusiformis]
MPGRSGLELLDQLASIECDSPVLISTLYDEETYGIRAIRRGVSGYLSKTAGKKEFINAVEIMLDGKKYLSANLMQSLMDAMHPSVVKSPHDDLSDREFQVLQRLAAGVAIKHLALEMCLSPKTVSTYKTRIMKKLGVSSLVGLIEYCLEHRLTSKQEASRIVNQR